MHTGDTLTLRIGRPVAGGRMLARHNGQVVLVAGALPGELVEVRIERVQRGTVWATVTDPIEASPDRVGEPNSCGGLALAHARYELQISLKQQIIDDAFRRIGRQPLGDAVPIVPSPVDGYRMRARLHVAGSHLGFYREGTHEICDARSTRQLLASTGVVLSAIEKVVAARPGTVLGVDVAENRPASERAIHLELAPEADPSSLGPLTAVADVSSVSYAHRGSPRVHVLSGEARVEDRFTRGDAVWTLARGPQVFFQGNRYLLDALVDGVIAELRTGPVIDLYAGVGLFSVAAACLGLGPVVAVEGDAAAARDLRRNASNWRERLQARHERVEDYLGRRKGMKAQTIVVDPPRTGLSRRALEGVVAAAVPCVVYVSCDVPTLARDARALLDAGYHLSAVRAFDLFPNTAHVETVATFTSSVK